MRLDDPLDFEGERYEYVLAVPRHGRRDLEPPISPKGRPANLIAIPEERALDADPGGDRWAGPKDHLLGTVHGGPSTS